MSQFGDGYLTIESEYGRYLCGIIEKGFSANVMHAAMRNIIPTMAQYRQGTQRGSDRALPLISIGSLSSGWLCLMRELTHPAGDGMLLQNFLLCLTRH